MKHVIKGILTLIIAITCLGITSNFSSVSAAKRHYTTIPAKLRGTWYHRDSYGYDKVVFSKYRFYFKGSSDVHGTSIYGNHFHKYGMGHSDLFVQYYKNGYYDIGQYASDEWPFWKRNGAHITQYVPGLGGPSHFYAYYRASHFK